MQTKECVLCLFLEENWSRAPGTGTWRSEERPNPPPPDEDDDGWGWIKFGLIQMEGAVEGIAKGVQKMQEGAEDIAKSVEFMKTGIFWERKGAQKLRKVYY